MKGYIFTYIFSIVVSSIVKILLDRNYVFDKVKLIIDNKEEDSFFSYTVIIILIYGCSMISSMIFYIIFWITFEKTESEEVSFRSFKICGYMIYKEDISEGFCHNCPINCSISADNCGYCLGCHYFNCFKCCCCKEYNNASDDSKTLCIVYKLKGILPWFFSLIAGPFMFLIIIFMYLYEILNLGFKPILSEYLNDKTKEKEITIMNIIYFSSIIFLYLINLLIGFVDLKYCLRNESDNSSIGYEKIGTFFFIFITSIISLLISSFFYFEALTNIIYYLIVFSVSISEYVNMLTLNFIRMDDIGSISIIGRSFALSFYKAVFKLLSMLFNLISDKGLVFIQFIVAIIVVFLQTLVILVSFFCPSKNPFKN